VRQLTNTFRQPSHGSCWAEAQQEVAMDRQLDREFGVSVVIALVLAIAVKVVMPSATAAGIEMTQIQTQNEPPAQSDLSWLVSP
jgi:hypothetical protein